MPVRTNESFDMGQDSSEHEPRIFLPMVLAIMAIRGSLLPWVTVREFSGEKHAISERRNAGRGFHPLGQFDGAAGKGDAM